ncbi:MAG: class I tRNA ligase family protein, partial [Patescibacteria group bacterium]
IGPYNEPGSYPWNLDGVASMRKFLERINRLIEKHAAFPAESASELSSSLEQMLARASAKIAEDGDRFKFNTGVAALMILMNELEDMEVVPRMALLSLVVMLAPFAPHLAEHLWNKLGGKKSVHEQSWPEAALAAVTEQHIAVQINGKLRGAIILPADTSEEDAFSAARALPSVQKHLEGRKPKRVIYVSGKIINLVV